MNTIRRKVLPAGLGLLATAAAAAAAGTDSDSDGVPDTLDACPIVEYAPAFDWLDCAPMDLDPGNDQEPPCKARERVVQTLLSSGVFVTHIAFAVVQDGTIRFADAFSYLGQGRYEHDPEGVHRLYRIGSTTKPLVATAAKVLEESGQLSLDDFVSDEDASRIPSGGSRTLRDLLAHRRAFKTDWGAVHLFCYPGNLAEFWLEPDDLISPHYDSATYGNLGGGYQYSAFNYSLAGAYLANRTGEDFAQILQTRLFDPAGMCTAMLDGSRGAGTPIGSGYGTSETSAGDVGPYINLVSPTDSLCEDNFYSSDDLYGDPYSWQIYHLDEADARARDPAGGVIASVIDMGHFAGALLDSYCGTGGLVSPAGVRDLWGAESDLGCAPGCPYESYYGLGFFTDSQPGAPVHQVGHGGSRAGYACGFVLRPEAGLAVCVLANADVSTVALSELAKTILDDHETVVGAGSGSRPVPITSVLGSVPNPIRGDGAAAIRFAVPRTGPVRISVYDVRGRRVTTLVDGTHTAGGHEIAWRPADERLAPGVYFVRMVASGATHVRKVTVAP